MHSSLSLEAHPAELSSDFLLNGIRSVWIERMCKFAQHVEGQGAQQVQHLYTISLGVGVGGISQLGVTGGVNYIGGSVPCSAAKERRG
jgi:hypothetical protein